MTLDEFIEYIDPEDWHLDDDGNLTDDNDDCPLWHVYRIVDPDEDRDAEDYIEAGVRAGLHKKTAVAIAQAADNRGEPRLRAKLLKAAGITEPTCPTTHP